MARRVKNGGRLGFEMETEFPKISVRVFFDVESTRPSRHYIHGFQSAGLDRSHQCASGRPEGFGHSQEGIEYPREDRGVTMNGAKEIQEVYDYSQVVTHEQFISSITSLTESDVLARICFRLRLRLHESRAHSAAFRL